MSNGRLILALAIVGLVVGAVLYYYANQATSTAATNTATGIAGGSFSGGSPDNIISNDQPGEQSLPSASGGAPVPEGVIF